MSFESKEIVKNFNQTNGEYQKRIMLDRLRLKYLLNIWNQILIRENIIIVWVSQKRIILIAEIFLVYLKKIKVRQICEDISPIKSDNQGVSPQNYYQNTQQVLGEEDKYLLEHLDNMNNFYLDCGKII